MLSTYQLTHGVIIVLKFVLFNRIKAAQFCEKWPLCSQKQNLFNNKYDKISNIVKQYYSDCFLCEYIGLVKCNLFL